MGIQGVILEHHANTSELRGHIRHIGVPEIDLPLCGRDVYKRQILEWLKSAAEKTESFLIPQDFGFLKRGGRLTPVAAALGSCLLYTSVLAYHYIAEYLMSQS